jgi:hypothetical protein
MSRTKRPFYAYCEATIPEIVEALNRGKPKGEHVCEKTVRRALRVLRMTRVPGRDHCFIVEERVGVKYRRYPVDKGGNCMHPSKDTGQEPDKIVPFFRTEMSPSGASATVRSIPARSGQSETENVNVGEIWGGGTGTDAIGAWVQPPAEPEIPAAAGD